MVKIVLDMSTPSLKKSARLESIGTKQHILNIYTVYCSFPRHVKNTFNSVSPCPLQELFESSKEMRSRSKNLPTWKKLLEKQDGKM